LAKGRVKGNQRERKKRGHRTNPYKLNKNSILATVKTTFRSWQPDTTIRSSEGRINRRDGQKGRRDMARSGKIKNIRRANNNNNNGKKKYTYRLNWIENALAIVCVSLWSSSMCHMPHASWMHHIIYLYVCACYYCSLIALHYVLPLKSPSKTVATLPRYKIWMWFKIKEFSFIFLTRYFWFKLKYYIVLL